MSDKKLVLAFFLIFFSILLGGVLGAFNIFGLLDERQGLNLIYLVSAIFLTYLTGITIFILDFTNTTKTVTIFLMSSLFFAFTFFIINFNPATAVAVSIIFFVFLNYSYRASLARSKLFVQFLPREIFVPVLRRGFMYLVIMIAMVGFFQAHKQVKQQNLVTPSIVKVLSKPTVYILNKQLGNQLQSQLGDELGQMVEEKREQMVLLVLAQTLESMAENDTNTIYGFAPREIPIHKTIVHPDGNIDLSPVIEEMSPVIAQRLNERLAGFNLIAPFVVALLAVIILQPISWLFNAIGAVLTLIVFRMLLSTKLMKIVKEKREIEKIVI